MAFSLRQYMLGDIREAEAGYVGKQTGKGRSQKATPEQIERNRTKRRKAVRLLIEANFGKGDPWICLKYRKGTRKSVEEVSKNLSAFCRRMRIAYKKEKQAFKWIARIEVGRLGGIHVHMICNAFKGGDSLSLITDIWETVPEASRANVEVLDDNPDSLPTTSRRNPRRTTTSIIFPEQSRIEGLSFGSDLQGI